MILNNKEMLSYSGGAITATFINGVVNTLKFFYTAGQNLGTTIRRIYDHSIC